MEKPALQDDSASGNGCRGFCPPKWLLAGGAVVVILLALLLPRLRHRTPPAGRPATNAEVIVARKVTQFARSRLKITQALAKRLKVDLKPDVRAFFETAADGRWEDLTAALSTLKHRRRSGVDTEDLNALWVTIHETFLVAQCAHDWPAQKLLDYGHSILSSLRPGMAYLGGDDPGRGIPMLLNETSEGEHNIVLTQNDLADGTYLEYLDLLYSKQMRTLTSEDLDRVFQEYIAGAQKRFAHDQEHPDEPPQLLPSENVSVANGRTDISGRTAVMAINEKMLQAMIDKNPGLPFALEESFPFKSTHANAVPLGPVMELGVKNPQAGFSADVAARAVDYWRGIAQQFASDTQDAGDSEPRKSYARMAATQAALLAEHNYGAKAAQAFRLAIDICPSGSEAVFQYLNLLCEQQRPAEAIPVVEAAVRAAPEAPQFQELLDGLKQTLHGN